MKLDQFYTALMKYNYLAHNTTLNPTIKDLSRKTKDQINQTTIDTELLQRLITLKE